MNEEVIDRTYLIKKKIERILEVARWEQGERGEELDERPIVTVHEGKIGKNRLVHVSNGLQRTLDSYTDENVKPGYIAFDVIVNPLAYRKYSIDRVNQKHSYERSIDRIARIAYDKFVKLRK